MVAFPTTQNNVQSSHLNESSLKLNFKYNSEYIHVKYALERTTTNRGTYLRPRVQMSDPLPNNLYQKHRQASICSFRKRKLEILDFLDESSDQQTRQLPLQLGGQLKGQSNVFKTPHVNLWTPVQRQPYIAEESRLEFKGYRSVSSVDCEMVSESEITEAQTACFDDNSLGSGNMKILSVSSVSCEMVSESENTEAQSACFDDNSSGSGSENMKIPSVSLVDCDMGV
ncbi:hypothetical protein Tco_0744770 [Tanacetum coccineum]